MKKFRCSKCDTSLKLPANLTGKSGRCPKCGTKIKFVASSRPKVQRVVVETPGRTEHRRASQSAANPTALANRQSVAPRRSMSLNLFVLILVFTIPAAGFFVYPEQYKKVIATLNGSIDPIQPHEIYGELELDVEKKIASLLDKLRIEFPETENGRPVTENGKVILNLNGMTQLDSELESQVWAEVAHVDKNESEFDRRTRLQKILGRLNDELSPMFEASPNTRLLCANHLQKQLQDITLDSWDRFKDNQIATIEKTDLTKIKFDRYLSLTDELASHMENMLKDHMSEGGTKATDEAFAKLQNRLSKKYLDSVELIFRKVSHLISSELLDENPTAQTEKRIQLYLKVYEKLVAEMKVRDLKTGELVVVNSSNLTHATRIIVDRRSRQIAAAVSRLAKSIQPPERALQLLGRLKVAHPSTDSIIGYVSQTISNEASLDHKRKEIEENPIKIAIELKAEELWKQLAADYPVLLADGQLQVEDGRTRLNQDGENEFNRAVGNQINSILSTPIIQQDYVRRTAELKELLSKIRDPNSILSKVYPSTKINLSTRIREKIQDAAVAAWERDYLQQMSMINKLPNLPESKIRLYLALNQEIEAKALERLRQLIPNSRNPEDREMFEQVQDSLMEKEAEASLRNFDAVFNIVKSEIEDDDKTEQTLKQLKYLFQMHSQFLTIYKKFDYETKEFETKPHSEWTPSELAIEKRRSAAIVKEVSDRLHAIEPAKRAIHELESLVKSFPACRPLVNTLEAALIAKAEYQYLVSSPVPELLRLRTAMQYQPIPELKVVEQIVARLKSADPTQRASLTAQVTDAYRTDINTWKGINANFVFRDASGREWQPEQIAQVKRMFHQIEGHLFQVGVRF